MASGRTVVVLCYIASRISSRESVLFLFTFPLAFSLCVLWCIHIVVWTQLQLGRNTVLFYRIHLLGIRPNEKISKLFPLKGRKGVASRGQFIVRLKGPKQKQVYMRNNNDRFNFTMTHGTHSFDGCARCWNGFFWVKRRMSLPVVKYN